MKTPGKIVSYIDMDNNVQIGRTYNREELMNGKVIVHLLTEKLEHVIDENGQNKKMLVSATKLTIKGFIE